MAEDPAARYESARALRADLAGLKNELDGATAHHARTAPTAPAPPTTSAPRTSVRFKALTAASAIAMLVAAWFVSSLLRRGHHVPPPEAVVWYNRGTTAIREGAYFQASKALERALAIDQAFALARCRQAEAYAEMGLTDRAREELLQALALLPDRSQLSAAESNYLDAVAATLNRDFQTAIGKYSLIVNAVDGSVPPTQIAIGRGRQTPFVVEVQAWDHAARLAGVCRLKVT
jgi:tetratricopeptide (TPR) repeat protein